MTGETNITLTAADALLFRLFRQHQDTFTVLVEQGVFDTKRGQCVLHFDSDGKLSRIDRNAVLFSVVVHK